MSEYLAVLFCSAPNNTNNIPPYDITEAAENNERGGDDVYQGICGVIAKTVFSNNINTSIAKGRNRIEY